MVEILLKETFETGVPPFGWVSLIGKNEIGPIANWGSGTDTNFDSRTVAFVRP